MEKVIEEIKQTEEAAEARLNDAKARADEIAQKALHSEEALRHKYELNYKESASKAVSAAKEEINELKAKENERFIKHSIELRQGAKDKISPCVDYVFDYILKEYTE